MSSKILWWLVGAWDGKVLGFKKNPKKKIKSRIRETKHLSTDADGRTNAIGGWTKNT